jgi:hypothetical protein
MFVILRGTKGVCALSLDWTEEAMKQYALHMKDPEVRMCVDALCTKVLRVPDSGVAASLLKNLVSNDAARLHKHFGGEPDLRIVYRKVLGESPNLPPLPIVVVVYVHGSSFGHRRCTIITLGVLDASNRFS